MARAYAGSERSSLFEIEVGVIDRGAFIGEYSQYEEEEEHVLAPLSHYEIVGKRRDDGINIYSLRLNVNGKTETLEELREDRRARVLEIAEKLNQECLQLTGHDSLHVQRIVKTAIEPVGYQFFNQGHNFSELLGKLESALVQELEEEETELCKAAATLSVQESQKEQVDKLRTCTKLVERCSAGNAEGRKHVLTAQERLVVAITAPGTLMASTSAAADDLVVLADHLENTVSDYARALEMLNRSLGVQQALDPPAPPAKVALIFHRQGRVLSSMGQFDEALVKYRVALDLRVQVALPIHAITIPGTTVQCSC